MPRDYYIILGVTRNAELNKIKKAYDTLSNEETRRKYDETLARQDSPYRITHIPAIIQRRASIFNELDSFTSSGDDFFSGFLPGFFDRARTVELISP